MPGSVGVDLQLHLVLLLLFFYEKTQLIIQQQLEGNASDIWNNNNRCG